MKDYEEKRPPEISPFEYEQKWDRYQEMRQELVKLQEQLKIYADALAEIAGAK